MAFALATIVVGLTVHRRGGALAPATRDVLGDALWAMMMYWWIGAGVPDASVRWRATAAVLVCFLVELSQLMHGPLLDNARATTAGQLILGSGFDPRDLAAYTIGVIAGLLVERFTHMNRRAAVGSH